MEIIDRFGIDTILD